jgi:hypothetical protein
MRSGVLDKGSLERNGITFSWEVMGLEDLRKKLGCKAEILAEGLLDFSQFATERKKSSCDIYP